MRTIAEELRKQFKEENPREELFTTFHVRWLEDKVIAFQQDESETQCPHREGFLVKDGGGAMQCSKCGEQF